MTLQISIKRCLACCAVFLLASCKADENPVNNVLSQIKLPEDFHISIYAEDVENVRAMTMGTNTLFAGSRQAGNLYALRDTNGDHVADKKWTIASGIAQPAGVAFRDGDLYVSAKFKILRFRDIENHLDNPPAPEIVYDQFPTEQSHSWKYIAFGPDGKLYVPVGAPCNICDSGAIYANITHVNTDGSGFEIYANGIRNTVGFDWHPVTGELWFTDNGRDHMGDDVPPDELNRAPQQGMHFGYPYCHGNDIADPDYGSQRNCREFTPPVQNLGPHVAALGMKFYAGNMFPAEYRNQVFIAEHGSWNRTTKIGYRVTLVKLNGNQSAGYEVFASGWEKDGNVIGRPADILILDDGSMLVSDDYGDRIYRIYYKK